MVAWQLEAFVTSRKLAAPCRGPERKQAARARYVRNFATRRPMAKYYRETMRRVARAIIGIYHSALEKRERGAAFVPWRRGNMASPAIKHHHHPFAAY